MDFAAEAGSLLAVAFGGAAVGKDAELDFELALLGELETGGAAFGGLAVEGLRDGGGTAGGGEEEDFDVEVAGVGADVEKVAGADVAGGFGAMAVGFDAAEIAGVGGEGAGFEEAGGPEPFVEADGFHRGIRAGVGGGW